MREMLLTCLVIAGAALPSHAQPPAAAVAPSTLVELHGGWAGFVDDPFDDHVVAGGALRWRLAPRLTVGPEITWMRGPYTDGDLFVQGALTWDLRGTSCPSGCTVPYVVGAGGLVRQHSGGSGGSWSTEGAVSAGAGVRIQLTERFHLAPEVRVGWEPQIRITLAGGWRF